MPPAAPRYHEIARSALESGPKAVAASTALQGAFATTIFRADGRNGPEGAYSVYDSGATPAVISVADFKVTQGRDVSIPRWLCAL